MSEKEEKKTKIRKPKREVRWEIKRAIPPEPSRIRRPEVIEIKVAPPPEPTRKTKPKEVKKGEG